VALTDDATVSYLVTSTFNAEREHGIDPTDPEVGLAFPVDSDQLLLSPKDTAAPSLAEAAASGLLPTWSAARAYYDELNGKG
jgi:dTDP-4-dehydrorhamnose 3,5-epimerase